MNYFYKSIEFINMKSDKKYFILLPEYEEHILLCIKTKVTF